MYIDLGNTGNNINFAPGGGGCKLEPRRADVGQKTLTLSEATKNVLTDAQKSLIEEKGWILS